jgi:hypothetical protein
VLENGILILIENSKLEFRNLHAFDFERVSKYLYSFIMTSSSCSSSLSHIGTGAPKPLLYEQVFLSTVESCSQKYTILINDAISKAVVRGEAQTELPALHNPFPKISDKIALEKCKAFLEYMYPQFVFCFNNAAIDYCDKIVHIVISWDVPPEVQVNKKRKTIEGENSDTEE